MGFPDRRFIRPAVGLESDRYKGEAVCLRSLPSISPSVYPSNEHIRLMIRLRRGRQVGDLSEKHLALLRTQATCFQKG